MRLVILATFQAGEAFFFLHCFPGEQTEGYAGTWLVQSHRAS